MTIDLTGKYALITGGSRGIGRAIAIALAKAGAHVAINYMRNSSAAQETATLIEGASGLEPLVVKGTLLESENVDALMDKVREEFGQLDILVSNAATGILKPALELTEKHWHWTVDTNARAFLQLVQKGVPLMGERGGRVIAISSLGAVRAIPNYTLVGASKAALESLVRHLAVDLGSKKITVNTISAGIVDTDALKHFPNRDELLKSSLAKTPAGRLTEPADVAKVALFLCSPLADMITGQTIVVDGGYSIVA